LGKNKTCFTLFHSKYKYFLHQARIHFLTAMVVLQKFPRIVNLKIMGCLSN
jgi:hypothetical protein